MSSSGPTPRLQEILSKVFKYSLRRRFHTSIDSVRVISAVVDAFPAPIPGTAADGFAYAVLHNTKNCGPKSIVTVADESDQHEHGTLEFQLSDDWYRKGISVVAIGKTHYQAEIKLANTLFQSGRKKTMLDVTYAVDPGGNLYPVHQKWLAHCSIAYNTDGDRKLINSIDERAYKTHKLFNVFMVPLTEPRKISVSLGNILRTIDLPDGSVRPASHELEANLDAYFKATGQAPHARPVWALLMNQSGVDRSNAILQNVKFLDSLSDEPVQRSSLEAIWAGPETATLGTLRDIIYLDGSKLQRVLSGGGGWGDKAGLLALDPQDSLRPQDINDEEISQFTSGNTEFTHVQFYTLTDLISSPLTEFPRGSWMGTIPDGLEKYRPLLGEKTKVYPDTFGALSSGGMSLRVDTVISGVETNTEKSTRTKVDVPFASFMCTLPESSDESTRVSAKHLVRLTGPRTLNEGTKMLRLVVDSIWSTVREATYELHRRAGVSLVKRRDEIKPMLDCIVDVKREVNPSGVGVLTAGILRFDRMVESGGLTELRRAHAVLVKCLQVGDELISLIVSQIGRVVRASNDDAREAGPCDFDMAARQRMISDLYGRLIPIVHTIQPALAHNHTMAMHRTFRKIWGLRLHYLHNQCKEIDHFLDRARNTIDHAKRLSNVPVTPYEGTTEAVVVTLARDLPSLVDVLHQRSLYNLIDMKHGRNR